ncbi:pantoate--beta-alanine ligase [Caproicibacterium lactatifermentans]|uniref:Pantothenate synthetase n=1 Tax=Caproicibacterium lactatifermentans TaxID=2666138 RepID=A0A859DRI9_9FIRM|nr:pantoate--beta-alanine ligase [Caproicibacterium lactatifermentans]QKN24518.1 pantoate--beta-alanine ligase [Caproicibacterium lactatifermentans]
MKLVTTIAQLRQELKALGRKDKTLGLVPTMGYLHEGHQSLIRKAKEQNDLVVVSDFVNPTQFGSNEDYDKYPRDIDRDCKAAEEAGADIVFHPDASEIYVPGASTEVEVKGETTHKLCGASRPIHFKGVTTIVCTLFHIVQPDRAYFGQKDAQQVVVVKKMVRDLHIPVKIVPCPIVREADGLAKSSRNIYLTPEQHQQALSLSRGLQKARDFFAGSTADHTSAEKLKKVIRQEISAQPLSDIEYVEVVDTDTLDKIEKIEPGKRALAAVAVRFGSTRLIDNTILGGKENV